ncbi:oxygenase MpaB family protein [Sinorhizobium numidicum]|uniref:oxygenase MpaB family protein n=1 Tax=Sinorhizobium numidicum TaxID=680248 RepID=UPI00247549D7|nr:oxygenase MpaB family protein [Sinorhizobium numidicum]WEX75768.1 oxygenase MpaB family protein [Sinorhizobium numidicum]
MFPPGSRGFDFSRPLGEPALLSHDSVSWRIYKNPVSLFIGGVAAVILELAEPAVRTGVWEHSTFRKEPLKRLQHTGLAAMMTVYGPRSTAEEMIAGVVRRHNNISGVTPHGERYSASDSRLLAWVQATAIFGFANAYSRYVSCLSDRDISQVFAEGIHAARLHGTVNAPVSLTEWVRLLDSMRDRLEPSPIIFEFIDIMENSELLPRPFRAFQGAMVRGAIEVVPAWVRERVGLTEKFGHRLAEHSFLRCVGALADRTVLPSTPPVQASRRLGLPPDYLYRSSKLW